LQTAYETAQRFGWSRDELEVYEYWSLREQGERGALKEARDEGRDERTHEIARTMRAKGLDLALIAEVTGLSPTEIATLEER
jgi:predicted transposase/invertase (TIGR01784 family)